MSVDENKMYTWLFMKKINIICNTTQVFTFEYFFLIKNNNYSLISNMMLKTYSVSNINIYIY
jgi:hypothetical protein